MYCYLHSSEPENRLGSSSFVHLLDAMTAGKVRDNAIVGTTKELQLEF